MRVSPDALRFPFERVLLARTKLAYVHLRNLLTDAKRDRAARVFGYVVVWLPEELLLLYLQEGEVVAATASLDGVTYHDVPIREALAMVPNAAEYGEICFHVADDEQLACMHAAQTLAPEPFPAEVKTDNASAVLGFFLGSTFDGMAELNVGGRVNYVVFRHGAPRRAFFADAPHGGPIDDAVRGLWTAGGAVPLLRRWPVPPPLPNQAAPALIDAYRSLVHGLTRRLGEVGVQNASQLVERARQALADAHPALQTLAIAGSDQRDPVTTTPLLARAVGAWVKEVMWAVALPDAVSVEGLLRELTRERRHLFQSAGFFDAIPWKVA